MSGRAQNWVWNNHDTKGTKLTVLLAIAKLSHRNSVPFKAYASYDSIARLCGISERYAIQVVAELVAEQQLEITREGAGPRAHYYDILPLVDVNRGTVLSLNTCSPLQQKRASDFDNLSPRTAEGDTSAAPSQPSNIVLYPTKRKRGAAAG